MHCEKITRNHNGKPPQPLSPFYHPYIGQSCSACAHLVVGAWMLDPLVRKKKRRVGCVRNHFMNGHNQRKFPKGLSTALCATPPQCLLPGRNQNSINWKRQSASGTTCTNLTQCFPPRSFDSISESLAWSAWFFICSSCGFHSEGTGRDHTRQIVALVFWLPYTDATCPPFLPHNHVANKSREDW